MARRRIERDAGIFAEVATVKNESGTNDFSPISTHVHPQLVILRLCGLSLQIFHLRMIVDFIGGIFPLCGRGVEDRRI